MTLERLVMRAARSDVRRVAVFAAHAFVLQMFFLCLPVAVAQSVVPKSTAGGSVHSKGGVALRPDGDGAPGAIPSEVVLSRIEDVQVTGEGSVARVALTVHGHGRLRVYVVDQPDRLVIEGTGLVFGPDFGAAQLAAGTLLKDFRYGALDARDGRLVFDTVRGVRIVGVGRAGDQVLITVSNDGLKSSVGAGADGTHVVDLAATAGAVAATVAPAKGGGWGAGTVVQRRPVVMIDPGHGGRDPGAVTDNGLYEKDVVLAVAKRVAAAIAKTGAVDVVMTRDGDQSVPLDRRVALTRAARADLFVSLHADTFAGQPQAATVRGGSIYVLADRASDRLAEGLALRENAADKRLGNDAGQTTADPSVDAFLADLTQRETRVFSNRAQAGLVRSLAQVMQLARDPTRGAAFRVLKQAETPAVLIELGYMSHAEDVVRLQAPDWQERVAQAIARAVEAYFAGPRSAVSGR